MFLSFLLRILIQLGRLNHIRAMSSSMRVSLIFILNLILAHARPENLFTLDSPDLTLETSADDASPLWNSNDITSDFTDLVLDPLDQDINLISDIDSFDYSNDLFASNSLRFTAIPSCESEGSQTDSGLQARDGYCQSHGTIDLPTELFQDPAAFLRDNLGTPPTGQINQPGQGDQKDENTNSAFRASDFKENEQKCPIYMFGASNIPVCNNPLTGRVRRERASNAVRVINAVPCRCRVRHFALIVKLLAIADILTRRYRGLPYIFGAFLLRNSDKQSEITLHHSLSMALFPSDRLLSRNLVPKKKFIQL